MNKLFEEIKPNVALLAILISALAIYSDNSQIQSLAVGGLLTGILMLALKPNPKVNVNFALAVIGKSPGAAIKNADSLIVLLAAIAGVLLALSGVFAWMSGAAFDNAMSMYIGGLVTMMGKMISPDESETVPESTVLAAIKEAKSAK